MRLVSAIGNFLKSKWYVSTIYSLIFGGFLLRLIVLYLFPHFIGEDSGPYIQAADFIRNRTAEFRDAYGYRQFLYPLIISYFYEISDYPLFILAALQVCATSMAGYFYYKICEFYKCNRLLTIAGLAFLVGNLRFLRYSVVVAPEPLMLFFTALIFYLFSVQLGWIKERDLSRLRHSAIFILLAISLFCVTTLKELFLPFVILVYLGYVIILIKKARPARIYLTLWSGLFASIVIFLLLYNASLMYSRDILKTDRLRPTCFPWPVLMACYFTDLETSTHWEFKDKVKNEVKRNRERLADWNYSYYRGNEKVNRDCYESNVAQSMLSYSLKKSGIAQSVYNYEAMCAVEDVGKAIAIEGIKANLPYYLKSWFLVEVYRALFTQERHKLAEEFMTITVESSQYYLLREFKDKSLYRYVAGIEGDPNDRSFYKRVRNGLNKRLPNHYSIFSALLLGGGLVYVLTAGWKQRDFYQNIILLLAVSQLIAIICIVASIAWFYERYTLYILFSLLFSSVAITSSALERLWLFARAKAAL